ncbi:MAG: metallophosphoesterase family protein [Actinomycetota bacterium]
MSDVHGNRHALEAVLRAARTAGVHEVWSLGDVVGYGAEPVHCLATVTAEAVRQIAGNHDLGAGGRVPLSAFSPAARRALEWTRDTLGPVGAAKLARLAPTSTGEPSLFHASPRDPVWDYVTTDEKARAAFDACDAQITFIGHTHVPSAWCLTPDGELTGGFVGGPGEMELGEGRWLINPGAVGQPRDGDPRAAWAVYDPDRGTIAFQRTPYDVAGAQNAILAVGLPEELAQRLAVGW